MEIQTRKRPYIKRFQKALLGAKDFLIQKLQEDWDRIEGHAEKNKMLDGSGDVPLLMTKIVLALATSGGTMSVVAISPDTFAGTGRMMRQKIFFPKQAFKKSVSYLARKKFIRLERMHYGYRMQSTERSRDRILALSYSRLKVKKIHPWDRVWRVVLFDIPNTQRWAREALRAKLKAMDFFRIQKSVFVTPYPCEKEVRLVTEIFSVDRYVRIIETASLGEENEIRRRFLL